MKELKQKTVCQNKTVKWSEDLWNQWPTVGVGFVDRTGKSWVRNETPNEWWKMSVMMMNCIPMRMSSWSVSGMLICFTFVLNSSATAATHSAWSARRSGTPPATMYTLSPSVSTYIVQWPIKGTADWAKVRAPYIWGPQN